MAIFKTFYSFVEYDLVDYGRFFIQVDYHRVFSLDFYLTEIQHWITHVH